MNRTFYELIKNFFIMLFRDSSWIGHASSKITAKGLTYVCHGTVAKLWRSGECHFSITNLETEMCHDKKSRSKTLKVPRQVYISGSWVPKVLRQIYISGSWVPKVPCQVCISRSWVSRVPRPVYISGSRVPKVPRQVHNSGSWVPKVP